MLATRSGLNEEAAYRRTSDEMLADNVADTKKRVVLLEYEGKITQLKSVIAAKVHDEFARIRQTEGEINDLMEKMKATDLLNDNEMSRLEEKYRRQTIRRVFNFDVDEAGVIVERVD